MSMWRWTFNLGFDFIFWAAIYSTWAGNQYAVMGENVAVFIAWFFGILAILTGFAGFGDNDVKSKLKESSTFRYFYVCSTSIMETLALAALGFTGAAIVYGIGSVLLCSARHNALYGAAE